MSLQETKLDNQLAGQFGGSNRGAGLGNLFAGKPPAAEDDAPEVDQEAPKADPPGDANARQTVPSDPEPPSSPPQEEPSRSRTTTRRRTSTSPRETPRRRVSTARGQGSDVSQTTVYVTPGVKKRFEEYKHKNRRTTRDVVLEAIASTQERWVGILDGAKYYIGVNTSLFDPDESKARYVGGGDVQIQFTPTPAQDAKLAEIQEQLEFAGRSTWIAPLLNAFLPGRKETAPDTKA